MRWAELEMLSRHTGPNHPEIYFDFIENNKEPA
jgi:hypothetical protein